MSATASQVAPSPFWMTLGTTAEVISPQRTLFGRREASRPRSTMSHDSIEPATWQRGSNDLNAPKLPTITGAKTGKARGVRGRLVFAGGSSSREVGQCCLRNRLTSFAALLSCLLALVACRKDSSRAQGEAVAASQQAERVVVATTTVAPIALAAAAPDAGVADAGPPTNLGGDAGCAGNLAQATFQWALCSCGDLQVSGRLTTDGYSSAQGAPHGGLGGNVGSNARRRTSAMLPGPATRAPGSARIRRSRTERAATTGTPAT